MQRSQSWSIIVFCYNEAGTIAAVIDSAEEFFRKAGCTDHEVIVVDDGSTDGSREIILAQAGKYRDVQHVIHAKNKGIGHALRSGYSRVTKENVTAIPGDGQFDVNELLPFARLDD